jgi:hypothetical protein
LTVPPSKRRALTSPTLAAAKAGISTMVACDLSRRKSARSCGSANSDRCSSIDRERPGSLRNCMISAMPIRRVADPVCARAVRDA